MITRRREGGDAAYTTCYVEGPPSEKIGRGLDALPQMMRPAESPNRGEGPPSEKIGRGLDALPQMMRPAETRNVVRVRPQKRSGAD